jgi:hypothetical protein
VDSKLYRTSDERTNHRHTFDRTFKSITEDHYNVYLNDENSRRKGSSDGSNEDDKSEQDQYFMNEEKVIKNHVRLNIILQILTIVIFLLAMIVFDWTHLKINLQDGLTAEYHISLMSAEQGDQSSYLFIIT